MDEASLGFGAFGVPAPLAQPQGIACTGNQGGNELPATSSFGAMDHFNATVKDGKLVKTRRGLQVSRQRFNGLSFVNASPRDTTAGPGPSGATGALSSSQQEIKFVEEGSESQSEGSYRKDAAHSESSGGAQGSRRRRRATRRGKSPVTSGAGTPSRPSPTPFEERSFQIGQPAESQDILHIDPTLDSSATGTTGDAASDPESPLSDEDRALFSRYFDCTPRNMYPDESILAYNPSREPDFYSMVTGDRAAQHCVLMCGSIAVAVDTQTEPKDLAYHISKICAILNRKLNQQHAADAVTLHCIAKLACVGCYVGRLDHWQLHMSGLQKVLDLNGGMAGLPPWLLAEMYKADLRGAVALVSSPYLSFTRQYSPISDVVPPEQSVSPADSPTPSSSNPTHSPKNGKPSRTRSSPSLGLSATIPPLLTSTQPSSPTRAATSPTTASSPPSPSPQPKTAATTRSNPPCA
ncbi:uncharacterized protein B0H64DRAFT_323126 [Chaetomium fimeti]|uniref:Uncharacterized protein n=1 Tax=Chaetomium fimeti TaxID=1854472 RepID=A0AAE0HFL9_9PEZI|nr:hypothetical protein B0H64DRAFT_323126 [Chaetomium fimeti]